MVRSLVVLFLVGVAYLPYAANAWQRSGSSGSIPIRGALNLSEMFEFLARWTMVHEALLPRWFVTEMAVLLWSIAIWGLTRKEYEAHARGYLLGGLLIPLFLLVVRSWREPILQPKMLFVTPLAFLPLAVTPPHW